MQGVGSEFWWFEGRVEGEEEEESYNKKLFWLIEEIMVDVEKLFGIKVIIVFEVSRVQDGGYQQFVFELEIIVLLQGFVFEVVGFFCDLLYNGFQVSGVLIGDSDIDMGGMVVGLLDQMYFGFLSMFIFMNSFFIF